MPHRAMMPRAVPPMAAHCGVEIQSHDNVQDQPALERLRRAIDHASHMLPAQGPITVFIHHNTLHAFESLPFKEALEKASRIFGCETYLPKESFRNELRRGRIKLSDLEAVLREELGAEAQRNVVRGCTRLELCLSMLAFPIRTGPTEELAWLVAETDALRLMRGEVSESARLRMLAETRRWVMRDLRGLKSGDKGSASATPNTTPNSAALAEILDRFGESRIEEWSDDVWESFCLQSLWRICRDSVARLPAAGAPKAGVSRLSERLHRATGASADDLAHEVLIPFCAAYLDQGVSHWQLPGKELGFFQAFIAYYKQPFGDPSDWRRQLARELLRVKLRQMSYLESALESLEIMGVGEPEWEDFLTSTLLALRGWAGMIAFLDKHPDRVPQPLPPDSLLQFLAVRLLLDRFAASYVAKAKLGFTGTLNCLRHELEAHTGSRPAIDPEPRAFPLFELAQHFGWSPPEMSRLTDADWSKLIDEVEAFSLMERRRIFHLAYERRLHTQALDAIRLNAWRTEAKGRPRFQIVTCLDEREESFRRHLEEIEPTLETFGTAGFFNVPMYFRGAADAHFVPLCPIVIRPNHWVIEEHRGLDHDAQLRISKARRALGAASLQLHVGSRAFALGAILTAGVGVLAAIPFVARILFPRLTASLRRLIGRAVKLPDTRLRLERGGIDEGLDSHELGFSVDEMAGFATRLLCDLGIGETFSKLVVFLGHGSTSLNNPHQSAYNCGACGGSPGAPNARAAAQILNRSDVRQILAQRGTKIPNDTWFMGGVHNTCNDAVLLFDMDSIPESHREDLERVQWIFSEAGDRNAHERCRRFVSAPLTLTLEAARQHVESRAEDLAQTRPELGHATNAICIVGRRERTRGLFLDRRAFLVSYDASRDDGESSILDRILSAVVPVCAGINLEYYFSRVDPTGFGCGTKLPHNISGLLGVMDGAASDLRTGLPWQMVEIHEPVRLLFVVECATSSMLKILARSPELSKLVRNEWIKLATLNPATAVIEQFMGGQFRAFESRIESIPTAPSSASWYRGWRDHLDFAQISPQAQPGEGS